VELHVENVLLAHIVPMVKLKYHVHQAAILICTSNLLVVYAVLDGIKL